jgi:signal transduction histidine kinase
VQREHAAEEIKRLQRCINDLVSVLALPALWSGGAPSQVSHTLLDTLLRMLLLDLVYVRLKDPVGEPSFEMVRLGQSPRPMPSQQEVCALLARLLGDDPLRRPARVRNPVGDGDISIVSLPLGLQGEIGVIAVGSQREDFPQQTESLLLSLAANQATLGLQEARLLSEQKRLTGELDQRVAQRTRQLADANEALRREIAERKLLEDKLDKARYELAQASRATTMGILTASIAHELNQPLSGIIMNASTCLRMLAADPPQVEGARETARRTIRDGNRASEVITRLRALFSKKDTVTESVNLNEAVLEVIALQSTELHKSRVVIRTELADDLPLVTGDRLQLQQVILNLLRNGSDAMSAVEDRSRQLVIRTMRDQGDRACLTVRDAGVGFDPRAADRLFDAFYTTKVDGMGIGLSVSRSIIESHQGSLWATLNDGPGAAFSFSIPGSHPALGPG